MITGNFDLNTIRIIIALGMLAIASVLDLRKREVNDILWICFGAIAFVMILVSGDILSSIRTIGVAMIIAPIALVAWRFGVFGGADALCLIVLGGLAPMASIHNLVVTPITTLTNAAILSAAPLVSNLCRNLYAISRRQEIFNGFEETRLNKIIAILVGYRAKNPRFGFSIEKINGGQKRLDFAFKHAEKIQFCTESGTWITPGIPYILYITGGFVIQILYGDMMINMISIVR